MNRFMKLLLSLVMAFNMIQFTPVFAEEDPTEPTEPQNEEVVEQEETVTEGVTEETPVVEVPVVNTTEVPETTEEEGPKLTYHDVDINVSKFAVKRTVPVNKGSMPASYDLRDQGWVSPVKDQDPYGTCWSFALMATAESNVLYQQLESDPDLSELQMAYWMYNRNNDPLGLTKGDKTRVYDSFLDTGGNDYLATFAIAGGLGYVDEELAPYTLALKMGASVRLNSRLAYMSNSYRLTEAKWMYMSDTDTVKEALMNGGAVAVSYYHDETYLSAEKYFDEEEEKEKEHWCYNSGDAYEGSSNHAVTLVGWDDNYPVSNFGYENRPNNNGAWLIKNSWGDEFWGEAGYFWISYEDLSLMGGLACQYTVVRPEEDENIYQYDGTTSASVYFVTEEETTGANVYTATRNEVIRSVGFFTDGDNTDYTVKVCLLNEDWSTPEDAVHCTVTTGTAVIAGYHEVPIEPVAVAENQQFSVIVTLNVEPDYENEEYAYMYVDESDNYEWIYFVNKTTPGTSYLYNLFGEETWDDISALGMEARIKAYTTPAPDYVDVTINTILLLDAGESGYLNPEFTPAIGNPDSIYWTSSDENIADVYGDGYVYAYEPGVAIISVYKTSDDSLLASCEVTVEQPIESVEADCDYIVVPTGGSVQVSAWVTPADTTEDRVIFWDLRDEDVVSLNWECTSNGDVQTVNYVDDGKVTIYAKAVARPDICKAITVFSGTPYETRDLADVQYDLSAYKRSYNSVTLEWETQENVTG
ncbi:MAG: hypothetical protein HUJ58_03610, partial [Erysipelotrichaceae bacterium]|nr:hypothetical protein [Erysipelotrichaceae bacterium]